ncbi:MAG: hydantoinase/oxoprolinase family protein, partial [Pseudomonadota bacterium]|nr:hydantoinase/oxoprolinase family protein [Pseudomonadota bacterium]
DRRGLGIGVDMRYASQNYELQVQVDVDGPDPQIPSSADLRTLFFAEHEQAYGFHNPEDPVDIVAVRLTASGHMPSPGAPAPAAGAALRPEPSEIRKTWFVGDDPIETPVYQRSRFAPGAVIPGPAVIDQFDATTLLYPGDVAHVDAALNLRIEVGE